MRPMSGTPVASASSAMACAVSSGTKRKSPSSVSGTAELQAFSLQRGTKRWTDMVPPCWWRHGSVGGGSGREQRRWEAQGDGGRKPMSTTTEELTRRIQKQPDASSSKDTVRELPFHVMVQRGLADSDAARAVSNEEM